MGEFFDYQEYGGYDGGVTLRSRRMRNFRHKTDYEDKLMSAKSKREVGKLLQTLSCAHGHLERKNKRERTKGSRLIFVFGDVRR